MDAILRAATNMYLGGVSDFFDLVEDRPLEGGREFVEPDVEGRHGRRRETAPPEHPPVQHIPRGVLTQREPRVARHLRKGMIERNIGDFSY